LPFISVVLTETSLPFSFFLITAYLNMTIQECRQHLLDTTYLTNVLIPLYQEEKNLPHFAKMRLLHQFFENGIHQNYHVQYLETLCTYLDQVMTDVFAPAPAVRQPAFPAAAQGLLHFALLPDLEDLLVSLRFYELIFSALEQYEVCANIAYLQAQVRAEISRKS
jgi:hypothetical protein